MWNDIDLYHAVRDFTSDPVSFPADQMKAFIRELVCHDQLLLLIFSTLTLSGYDRTLTSSTVWSLFHGGKHDFDQSHMIIQTSLSLMQLSRSRLMPLTSYVLRSELGCNRSPATFSPLVRSLHQGSRRVSLFPFTS